MKTFRVKMTNVELVQTKIDSPRWNPDGIDIEAYGMNLDKLAALNKLQLENDKQRERQELMRQLKNI